MLKQLPILALLALASVALADKRVMKINFAGTDVGESTYEDFGDGRATSKTKFTIMGMTVDSTLNLKFEGKKLVAFDLAQAMGTDKGGAKWARGSYTVDQNGKKSTGKLNFRTNALFSNYHPMVSGTVAAALSSSQPGAQTVEVLVIDGLSVEKIQVLLKTARQATFEGKNAPVRTMTMDFGAVKVDYPIDAENNVIGMDVPTQRFQGLMTGWSNVYVDPVAKYTELSQPTHTAKTMVGVKMKMRDGVELVADVVLPAEEGKYPVILSRTPYGRAASLLGAEWWAKRGYAVVSQDVRGRHDSDGAWDPFMNERADGYDTIDWIANQPWCDGNVGMIGASYGGLVQWAAAVERHPALKCIVPQVSPPDAFFNIPYDHGVFMLWGNLWWSNIVKDKVSRMELASAPMKNVDKVKSLPLSNVDNLVFGRNIPWFDAWLKKDRPSHFKGFDYGRDMAKVDIPALHISGWFDGDGIGTKLNWATMLKAGRTNQWLIYGPWTHAFNSTTRLGDVDYGSNAILELESVYLRWFDTWLKGKDVKLAERQPKAKIFLTGANKWLSLSGWPDQSAKQTTMYFGVDRGTAVGKRSQGKLTPTFASRRGSTSYIYDPRKVEVPEELKKSIDLESANTHIEIERSDRSTLLYKSAPMKQAMDVTGPLEVDLYFSTSVKDTDFFVMLVDVDSKGTMRVIGLPGKIRAKYLSGWETPSLLTPGKTYKASIPLWDTAHRFNPGHRMAVLVMSQMFPMYARNLNTGESYFTGTKMVTARTKIYHDKARPSALRFYVLPQN